MSHTKSPDPVDKHIGARVRMARLQRGMSQEKLGDALTLTFQQVQKYEKGTNRIGGSRMAQIASILQVPVSFFYQGAPNIPGLPASVSNGTPSPNYIDEFLADRDGHALARAFMRVADPKIKRRVVDLVETVARAA